MIYARSLSSRCWQLNQLTCPTRMVVGKPICKNGNTYQSADIIQELRTNQLEALSWQIRREEAIENTFYRPSQEQSRQFKLSQYETKQACNELYWNSTLASYGLWHETDLVLSSDSLEQRCDHNWIMEIDRFCIKPARWNKLKQTLARAECQHECVNENEKKDYIISDDFQNLIFRSRMNRKTKRTSIR